jgi:hypothetical protein
MGTTFLGAARAMPTLAARRFCELLAQCLIARSAREDRAFGAAVFLARLQTKSVSARSFVQDSGARS